MSEHIEKYESHYKSAQKSNKTKRTFPEYLSERLADCENRFNITVGLYVEKNEVLESLLTDTQAQLKAQKEYSDFLGKAHDDLGGYFASHPHMGPSQETIDKGIELREKIKLLTPKGK